MMVEIWHNPRCGKSRTTLKLLEEKGEEYRIVEYLKSPPDQSRLKEVVEMLQIPAEQLIRKGEKVFKAQFKGQTLSNDEWIRVMSENAILIERPIVIKNGKARIGRPPERVLEIL